MKSMITIKNRCFHSGDWQSFLSFGLIPPCRNVITTDFPLKAGVRAGFSSGCSRCS